MPSIFLLGPVVVRLFLIGIISKDIRTVVVIRIANDFSQLQLYFS